MRSTMFVGIVSCVVGWSTAYTAENVGTPHDETAIMQLMSATTQAFNEHDAVKFAQFYTEDADLVTVRGERMKGREQIESGLAAIVGSRAQSATLRTIETSVRFITPDVAVVHATNEMSGLVRDGKSQPAHRELSLRVVRRNQGVWRVAAFHNTLINPF